MKILISVDTTERGFYVIVWQLDKVKSSLRNRHHVDWIIGDVLAEIASAMLAKFPQKQVKTCLSSHNTRHYSLEVEVPEKVCEILRNLHFRYIRWAQGKIKTPTREETKWVLDNPQPEKVEEFINISTLLGAPETREENGENTVR